MLPDRSNEPTPEVPGSAGDELEQVRELLFGREKTQLTRLRERLEDPQLRAQDVSRVLPDAVRHCATGGDDRLARELTPAVELALRASVRRDPSILVSAIFPIMGPAIRRSTADAISRLLQAVNQALEHGLSWRGLRWRWEAIRTGRSYAEIVILRSLVFRVERVLLIERPTGLLLEQVTVPEVSGAGGEQVSGMLTAIQDFVRDSFRVGPEEPLRTLQVGELSVWVESGPRASLAAVIRGHAPMGLRPRLQSVLERVHAECGEGLSSEGEKEGVMGERVRGVLEECLVQQLAGTGPRSLRKVWVLASMLAVVLAVWMGLGVWERVRWGRYLERLAAEEGLLVVRSERVGGRWKLVGLRDPLAVDPVPLLAVYGFRPEEVEARWEAYQAGTPGLVLKRARRVLSPPEGVVLAFEGGVLRGEGLAGGGWVTEARRRVELLPEVESLDLSRVFDPAQSALSEALRKVESVVLYFGETTRLNPGQDEVISELVSELKRLREAAVRAGRSCRVTVVGHTDRKGTAEYNRRLGVQRAEEVRVMLEARGVPAGWLRTEGVGASQPARAGMTLAEETLNRRVTMQVRVAGGGEEPGAIRP